MNAKMQFTVRTVTSTVLISLVLIGPNWVNIKSKKIILKTPMMGTHETSQLYRVIDRKVENINNIKYPNNNSTTLENRIVLSFTKSKNKITRTGKKKIS